MNAETTFEIPLGDPILLEVVWEETARGSPPVCTGPTFLECADIYTEIIPSQALLDPGFSIREIILESGGTVGSPKCSALVEIEIEAE